MDATTVSAVRELESFEEISRCVVDVDYLVRNAHTVQLLQVLLERLQFIYFSRKGILPFLIRLQNQDKIEDHEWKDLSFNFPLERETVAEAADAMQRHMSDLEARFGAEFSNFLIAITDLKFEVRKIIEGLRTALRKDSFSTAAVAAAAQSAAMLVPGATTLKQSLSGALEKLDAYESA